MDCDTKKCYKALGILAGIGALGIALGAAIDWATRPYAMRLIQQRHAAHALPPVGEPACQLYAGAPHPEAAKHAARGGEEAESAAEALLQGKRVVLDPGHGMSNRKEGMHDPGAVYGGIKESELCLRLSAKAGEILSSKRATVIYTRASESERAPLSERAALGKGADAYVSIHCNAALAPSARGVRVFYRKGCPEGKALAEFIYRELTEELSRVPGFEQPCYGVREGDYYVLRCSQAAAAALAEVGFLSNDGDRRIVAENSDAVARGIAKGVECYLRATAGGKKRD
ncbi:MAG: N-acetylmuramoyl-L-alanine amidase [Candidatus Aenigmatarchaeota archaeon]